MPRGRVVVRSGRRKVKQWIGTSDQGAVTIASGAKVIIQSVVPVQAATIIRSRGLIQIKAQSGAADVSIDGAYGIAIVSSVAFGIGITAIPGPFTDSGWGGWLFHQFFALQIDVTTDIGRLAGSGFTEQYEIDSKAMRKIGANEVLVDVCESRAGACFCTAHVRTLVLES